MGARFTKKLFPATAAAGPGIVHGKQPLGWAGLFGLFRQAPRKTL